MTLSDVQLDRYARHIVLKEIGGEGQQKLLNASVGLIGAGGIGSADDAWERIRAGASLVQLYSAMVFAGPGVARRIVRGLEVLMRRDGFGSIAEAVGSE